MITTHEGSKAPEVECLSIIRIPTGSEGVRLLISYIDRLATTKLVNDQLLMHMYNTYSTVHSYIAV